MAGKRGRVEGDCAAESLETFQEFRVGAELSEAAEDQLHRLDLVHGGERAAQLDDLREVVRAVELLFLAGARLRDVDAREDPAVEEVAVEQDLRVAGPLELLEDDLVHP